MFKAEEVIKYQLQLVNDALEHCDNTHGLSFDVDLTQLEIKLFEL